MTATAILAFIPILIKYGPAAESAIGTIVGYVTNMINDGRTQTTAQETAALQAAIADCTNSDAAFDAAFANV